MSSLATLCTPHLDVASSPIDIAALDAFVTPAATSSVADARPRSCVVLDVVVRRVTARHWTGNPVFEVTVADRTGSIVLAFVGHDAVAGVEKGRGLVAAGTVCRRAGRSVVRNPRIWLRATSERGAA